MIATNRTDSDKFLKVWTDGFFAGAAAQMNVSLDDEPSTKNALSAELKRRRDQFKRKLESKWESGYFGRK